MERALQDRVAVSSRRMALLVHGMALAAIAAGVVAAGVALVRPDVIASIIFDRYPGVTGLGRLQVLLVTAFGLGQLGLVVASLLSLARMFAGAEPLGAEAARHMLNSGRWLLAATLFGLAAQIPATAIISMNNPQGMRFIALSASSAQVMAILASMVLCAVAHILELAARVRDDHRQIV